jgi:hypothetical protein
VFGLFMDSVFVIIITFYLLGFVDIMVFLKKRGQHVLYYSILSFNAIMIFYLLKTTIMEVG